MKNKNISAGKLKAWADIKTVAAAVDFKRSLESSIQDKSMKEFFVMGRKKGVNDEGQLVFVVICPFCCRNHYHVVDKDSHFKRKIIGHFDAPCFTQQKYGYYLVRGPVSECNLQRITVANRHKQLRDEERSQRRAEKQREEDISILKRLGPEIRMELRAKGHFVDLMNEEFPEDLIEDSNPQEFKAY